MLQIIMDRLQFSITSGAIYWAARNGHTEIVEILASLTDNPNAPNKYGNTPIQVAANGQIEQILCPDLDLF